MKIVIIGCGLGGLACAISCLKAGLQVVLLERAPNIQPVGAGIQLPPNAVRVLQYFGVEDELTRRGAVRIGSRTLRRYSDGTVLCTRPGLEAMVNDFGASYYVIHRADYQELLLEEAIRLGMDFRTDCEVVKVSFEQNPRAILKDGSSVVGDVLVGADGLWSTTRDQVLGHPSPPIETGDVAFRGTFPREMLQKIDFPGIRDLIQENNAHLWMGPGKHCNFYPIRDGKEFNLVFLIPDDLPDGVRTAQGSVRELECAFEGWDPTLLHLISCMNKSLLKWKLLHHHELESWVKGNVALLGDACHPSLPYQAQGAAMAVEDGAVLGLLLGKLVELEREPSKTHIHSILTLYESVRKSRTSLNVEGSIHNRRMFHMGDGVEQEVRDQDLAQVDWKRPCPWQWGDIEYQRKLMGFDVIEDAASAFQQWSISHLK